MAYKIPNLPSAKSYIEEKADFWEVQAIINEGSYYSQMEITRVISKELDEINHDGIMSEDDYLDDSILDVYKELTEREKSTVYKYPFDFGRSSIRLKNGDSEFKSVYLFLLLCTRFSMNKSTNKVQNGIDATLLFEDLCATIAKNYFGKNSESYVFGTATKGNFESKIKTLISYLGEGDGFKNSNNNIPTKNDDGIDVVVWKHFKDQRIGKLIGFAQCKTGTSWQDEIKKLNPNHFCENWLYEKPVFPPIPIVFICDTLNLERNYVTDQRGLLIFNRFRIMEYLPDNLPEDIIQKIRRWLSGAIELVA